MSPSRPPALRTAVALRLGWGLLALLALALARPSVADEGDAVAAVEAEFREAIRRITPATVTIVPWRVQQPYAGFSSGVIVSPDGFVLSDGDAGMRWRREDGREVRAWLTEVEVRLAATTPEGQPRRFRARVLHRDREADSSLLRIVSPPDEGLPFVPLGRSDAVDLGDFAFALGTAFDEEGRAPPTLTAGIIAAREAAPPGTSAGRFAFLYTSAAVNQGVNGGPLVDLEGRLIGTISTWVEPEPDAPYQMLGKAVPVDRIRQVHDEVPGARVALRARAATLHPTGGARALEAVFRTAARRVRPAVVSLDVQRAKPVSNLASVDLRETHVPRYQGPVSGLVVSADGWIVTSLYNLTNVGTLVDPLWEPPADAALQAGLSDIRSVRVHFAGGHEASARYVAHDRRLGIALFKADVSASGRDGWRPNVPEAAPPEAFEAGRFVVAVGDPFGAARAVDPLVTIGILSRYHPDDAPAAWRGQWQTDAAGMDTNSGGAAVDIEGRLLGLFTVWNPARHGRSSGTAFVVPWERILAALPDLQGGREPVPGFLGVRFARALAPRIDAVIDGTAASTAGLRAGDRIYRIDREDVPTAAEAIAAIGHRCAGERIAITVERDGTLLTLDVMLTARPASERPR